jgi:RNA polymerase sigma-70 factor, ECF subfamily
MAPEGAKGSVNKIHIEGSDMSSGLAIAVPQARESSTVSTEILQQTLGTGATAPAIDPTSTTDAALIDTAKAGNHDAFEALVRRHSQKILSIALRLTGNREDAEDVVQQSLLKAFVHLREFEGKSSFSTWLTRIALNEGLMLLRSRRKFTDVSIDASSDDEENTVVLQLAHPGLNPEDAYLQTEQHQTLTIAINRLRPSVRRAIQIKELDEMSVKETAGALGVSFSAVKSRILRGRQRLQETMDLYQRTPQVMRAIVRPIRKANKAARVRPFTEQKVA